MQKLPVLVTFFNRPNLLEELLRVLANRQDLELYFASDGPRNVSDEVNIKICWDLVDKYFGAQTSSKVLKRNSNLGCKIAMKENLDWFFSENVQGCVLEDDCIPSDSFFEQMKYFLEHFKHAKQIMLISGSDFRQKKQFEFHKSVRASVYPMVWGWGGWSEKWQSYKLDIPDINDVVARAANQLYGNRWSLKKDIFQFVFRQRFGQVNGGVIDTWDYSLLASMWRENLYALHLNGNQVINAGFGSDATHTKDFRPFWARNDYDEFEWFEPYDFDQDDTFDKWLSRNVYSCNLTEVAKVFLKKIMQWLK